MYEDFGTNILRLPLAIAILNEIFITVSKQVVEMCATAILFQRCFLLLFCFVLGLIIELLIFCENL